MLKPSVAKSVKISFYDLGVRNSLIRNFAPMSVRSYEFKWRSTGKTKEPADFLQTYPGGTIQRVDRCTYWQFLL